MILPTSMEDKTFMFQTYRKQIGSKQDSLTSADSLTSVGVTSIVREPSDAWHVPGGPGAPLNRTPISNEYREESPRVRLSYT